MADTDTDHISNEQLEAIGMSRDEWEKYTSYYADLMDDALSKPAPPSVWNLGGILPEIRMPKTDLIDDYATFVEKLSKDPQIKNLFVEGVDRKYTPLGADPNMGFRQAMIKNLDGSHEEKYLDKFKFADDYIFDSSPDESKLTAQGRDINEPQFQGFDPPKPKKPEPEKSKTPEVTNWGDDSQGYGESQQQGGAPVKPAPQKTKVEELKGVYDEMKLDAAKAQRDLQKRQIEQANRLRERRRTLKGGYKGGVDQYDYDQALLKGNRLGDKFRLRTPEEREARVREGQYNITAPRRRAEANMGATIRGMKQWADDTTGAPKALADPELSASRKQETQSNRDSALRQAIQSVSGKQPNRLTKYTAPKEPPVIPDDEKDLWEKNKKNTALMNRILSNR